MDSKKKLSNECTQLVLFAIICVNLVQTYSCRSWFIVTTSRKQTEVNKQKKSTLLLDNILEIIEAVIGGMLLIHDASRLSLK